MPTKSANAKPSVIDLFAGVGGLSLGAARAGFDLRLGVERDPQALSAHSLNFPGTLHSSANISSLTGSALLESANLEPGELCGLIGGPPCQGFSTIGRREVGDNRNLLFHKFFKLVQETKPLFYLAENVPGIMNECYDGIREEALSGLSDYISLNPFQVSACDYGAPTTRKRVLFFGYRADAFPEITQKDFSPASGIEKVTVGSALAGLPVAIKKSWISDELGWRRVRSEPQGQFGARARGMVPVGVGHAEALHMWRSERRTSGCIATIHEEKTVKRFSSLAPGETDSVSRGIRLDPNGYCPTLRAGTDSERGSYQAVRPIHPTEPRVITPREAARLQGFPDWFRFDPTKWHSFRQIGNSVSPILAERILSIVRAKLAVAPDMLAKIPA